MRRLLIAVAVVAAIDARADSWALPERETFDSANGQWRLTVTPKQLKGQLGFFSDKVAGKPDAGAARGVTPNEARGELSRKNGTAWQRVAQWRLVNEVAPVSALVANDGTVVTFDNWHSLGYGDDVVVIYRSDGTLVRKLGLSDFMLEEDIHQLSHSVSSIQWSETHRLDESKRMLILRINARKVEEMPVSLETGRVLAPKRAMFRRPAPRVTWTAAGRHGCIPAAELTRRVIAADPPAYTSVAQKAKIAGVIVIDIAIDRRGKVVRADVIKPLPFGLDRAARDAVMKWRFRPSERGAACGRVRIRFEPDVEVR